MQILNIQKTTFQMPAYSFEWYVMVDMLSIYQNTKYRLNKLVCNKLLNENNYTETTTTISGERVTIIKLNGLKPLQVVKSILL